MFASPRSIAMALVAWLALAGDRFEPARGDQHTAQVTVGAISGRKLSGVVDARTDEHRLWLRSSAENIELASSVAWADIETVTVDGETTTADSLRQIREGLATEMTRLQFRDTTLADSDSTAATSRRPTSSVRSGARMRNVDIVDACLVNLDRDVEPDSLQIAIAALDEQGRPMQVSGSLAAELVGERRPALISQVDFGPLDRWTQPVRASDFTSGVATYLLPFRRAAPQWQFDVLPDALLTVRLGAFGQGNFGASAPVVIRALNPIRDDRQLLDETRFMPGELRGRNPHNRLTPENGLWLHWTR